MLFKVLLAGMCSLCLVGTATLASAHEFIVKPDKTQCTFYNQKDLIQNVL